ncbi:hypothetical protein L7F22_060731 [Adiantum nelumboides]|nr:hypothetical protein [Adiantum nelumboides]MCO5606543.1 hypothetical protein [Adiantum nelumboides]
MATGMSSAPVPQSHSEDHHHSYKSVLLILLIIAGILTVIGALLFHASRKRATASKGRKTLSDRKQVGSDHAQTSVENEQASLSDVSLPSHFKDVNHQQQVTDAVSLASFPGRNTIVNSREMVTLQEGWPAFNMDELLRSFARPLYGQGVFGTAYKVGSLL